MERYFLAEFAGITVFLHRFLASDGDRFVHDHPWRWSLAWLLCGGYREERLQYLDPNKGWHSRQRNLRAGGINFLGIGSFHRIQYPQPETWTLFLHGKRLKSWGFLNYDAVNGRIWYQENSAPAEARGWKTNAPRGAVAGREPFSL